MLMQSVATTEKSSAKTSTESNGPGPGEGPMPPSRIVAVALYLVVLSVLVLYVLLKVWPYPTPSGEPKENGQAPAAATSTTTNGTNAPASQLGQSDATPATGSSAAAGQRAATTNLSTANTAATATGASGTAATNAQPNTPATSRSEPSPPPRRQLPDPETISFVGGRFKPQIYLETRLLLLVMLCGALGSLMHALRSLYWYTGNRKMVWSWVAFYLLLPFTGAMLAVIFYLVVRGGFFSPQASTETTSPFGFAALSALVGLFSPQATLKLKEVAETIFTKPAAGADHKPQGSHDAQSASPAPTISSVSPSTGKSTGTEKVTIAGTGFVNGAQVRFGGIGGTVVSTSSTAIEVITPASSSGPGAVDILITNPDGTTVTLAKGYTYLANDSGAATGAVSTVEKPVTGEGGDDELIDGCDVDLKADTADEELPITEGGVR